MKFYLEVQTEERYYQDCFSRMIFLHQPIGGVKHCIELLKVASQIEYKELMDICLRCLSAIPWSSDEEEQIHDFCVSGQHFSLDSADDLRVQLRLDLTGKEKLRKVTRCVERTLSRYLQCAFKSRDEMAETDVKREESRKGFEKAFEAIVSGAVCGKTSENVLQCALTLVKEEADVLISSVMEFDYGEDGQAMQASWIINNSRAFGNETKVLILWWLFQTLRKADAAQAVVEVLLEHEDFGELMMKNFDLIASWEPMNELLWLVFINVKTTMREMIMVL